MPIGALAKGLVPVPSHVGQRVPSDGVGMSWDARASHRLWFPWALNVPTSLPHRLQASRAMFTPSNLFAEFLATCSVDTVGMFRPVLGYAAGMDGRIVHEPFKAKIFPTAPTRYRLGVHPVDCVLRYVV